MTGPTEKVLSPDDKSAQPASPDNAKAPSHGSSGKSPDSLPDGSGGEGGENEKEPE